MDLDADQYIAGSMVKSSEIGGKILRKATQRKWVYYKYYIDMYLVRVRVRVRIGIGCRIVL